MNEPLLRLDDVTKRFGGTVAADSLTFAVQPGRITSLIGPNGAGKSTAVNLIAGRYRPDRGRLEFRGAPLPLGAHRVARAGIGRLFQEVRLFGGLTVLENLLVSAPDVAGEGLLTALATPWRVARQERALRDAAQHWLEVVKLPDLAGRLAGRLSYGQQKLVAIARLLMAGSALLLLDEPASGINPRLVEELADLLRRLVAEGRTVLLVEHNMRLVRQVSTDVVLLDQGRCRAAGPVEEVWQSDVMSEVYYAPVGD